jgi:hypothetical protein
MKSVYACICKNNIFLSFQKFFLFLTMFSIIVDPTNTIFGIKNISFILFMLSSLSNLKCTNIIYIFPFIGIFIIPLAYNQLFPNSAVDFGQTTGYLKSFLFLFFILVMNKNSNLPAFKYFYILNLLVALFCCAIWLLLTFVPGLESPFCLFFMHFENYTIAISRRVFIGIKVLSVFHKTCILSTICLAYSMYMWLFRKNRKYCITTIIFLTYLIFSGTRANMLSGCLIFSLICLYKVYKSGNILLFITLCLVILAVFFSLIFKLLNDNGEKSLEIKSLHIVSYQELFSGNPFRYLFIGDGPGATFYTKGFNETVAFTELSYYDLIREYGLIFTIVFVSLFCYPFLGIYNHYSASFFMCFCIGFLAFMFIAGTNPYLVSSNGFTVLAIYYYIMNGNLHFENN